MDNIINKFVEIINGSTELVRATIPDELQEYREVKDEKVIVSLCKVIHIQVKRMYHNYKCGQSWNVFANDIDNTIKLMKRKKDIMEKIDSNTITAEDVQLIIKRASFNCIDLPLNK